MLKLKITKKDYEALDEGIQKLYKLDGDNATLEVDGLEDTGALKRAKDREAQEKKEAQAKLKEAQEALAKFEGDDARKNGDIATLEKAWEKKNGDQKAAFEGQLAQKDSFIQTMLVDNKANEIATKISKSPALILPHIKSRLSADLTGEVPLTKVLDKDGKVSAMTLDELSKEFVDNAEFAPIIVGNKASGSGAGGTKTTLPPSGAGDESADLSKLSPKKLAETIKSSKQAEE